MLSERHEEEKAEIWDHRLNPCCNGICSRSAKDGDVLACNES